MNANKRSRIKYVIVDFIIYSPPHLQNFSAFQSAKSIRVTALVFLSIKTPYCSCVIHSSQSSSIDEHTLRCYNVYKGGDCYEKDTDIFDIRTT